MKPAPLHYTRVGSLDHALELLANASEETRIIAGGQSLGPLLNLRLASPRKLIDISQVEELRRAALEGPDLVVGPCVTHAEIEDGEVPDVTRGLMAHVARGIAYRPVRNRGTLGGSLAHADPAADWVAAMMALGAGIRLRGGRKQRTLRVDEFIRGPLSTAIEPDEIIVAVCIPELSATARWGHAKFARKPGDFAESMALVVIDRDRGFFNAVLARRAEPPTILRRTAAGLATGPSDDAIDAAIADDLATLEIADEDLGLHRAIIRRAMHGASR
jgi:carbon-monoxide dehydrogenase medium subunit